MIETPEGNWRAVNPKNRPATAVRRVVLLQTIVEASFGFATQ
jgi:hypothetical protein